MGRTPQGSRGRQPLAAGCAPLFVVPGWRLRPRGRGRRPPLALAAARLAQVEGDGGSGALSVLHGRLVLTRSPPPTSGPSRASGTDVRMAPPYPGGVCLITGRCQG